MIFLPPARHDGPVSLEKAMAHRHSVRSFSTVPLSLEEAAQLLWAAQGMTGSGRKRTIPSAGALYPLEIFLVAGTIDSLDPGIYRYLPDKHGLIQVVDGDVRDGLRGAALGQKCIGEAPASLVFAAVHQRTAARYGSRSSRYVDMEIGHAGQNIYLQTAASGLATVAIGAFDDSRVHEIMQMTREEAPLYIMPVGRKRG